MAVKPTPLDTAHAIPELAALVKFVEEHGETTRAELLAALAAGDEKKAAEIKSHIAWLVEKGHLIGFSDGALTVPAKFPKHAQQRRSAGEGRAPARPAQGGADAINCVPPVDESVPGGAQLVAPEEVPAEENASGGAQLVAPEEPGAPEKVSQEEPKVEEPKVEIQEEVKKDETADQLAE